MKREYRFIGWALVAAVLGWGALAEAQRTNQPDLVVKAFELEPLQPRAGQGVTVRVTVANDSLQTVRTAFDVLLTLDGATLDRARILQLGPRQQRAVEFGWQAQVGEHTLKVKVDQPRNRVQESNERNNEASLTVSVAPDAPVESFFGTSLRGQAEAWEATSLALTLVPSQDLFAQLSALKDGFGQISRRMGGLTSTLGALQAALPPALRAEADFQPLIGPYRDIGQAAAQVQQGLDRLDLAASIEAMRGIEAAMRALAALDRDSLPLGPLAAAADTLHAVLEAAGEAQARFGDPSRGPVDEPLQALFGAVDGLSAQLAELSQGLAEAVTRTTARFLDPQGQPVRELAGTVDVVITAPAAGFTFELLDAQGETLLTLVAAESSLEWTGQDDQGRPLAPGTYFFRLRWRADGAAERVDLGRLTLGEG